MTAYFTSADAEIRIVDHPVKSWNGKVLDVAHFQLMGGRTPFHIWNYARRKDATPEQGGGAPFDDTALGNEVTQLQLIVNRDRYREAYFLYRPMSQIGNVRVTYRTSETGAYEEAGYLLVDGHVGQNAEEITIGNALFMSVPILFRTMEPFTRIPAPDEQLATDLGVERLEVLAYNAEYTVDGDTRRRLYDPSTFLADAARGYTLVLLADVIPGGRMQMPGPVQAINTPPVFRGALLEIIAGEARRHLFAWNPCQGRYLAVSESPNVSTPIISGNRLVDLAKASTILLVNPADC